MLAIVLSRCDFREYDQIISLYAQACGKIEAVAKGVKKIISKQAGHLEPFTLVTVDIIKGREINHVAKAQSVNVFKNIRNDLRKSLLAGYAVNLVDNIVAAGEKDDRIFNLLKGWLENIDEIASIKENLLYGFIIRLFACLGFAPELGKCVSCGSLNGDVVGFDVKNGGPICVSCAEKATGRNSVFPFSGRQVEYLQILLSGGWSEVSALEENKDVFEVIRQFARFHSEKEVKTPFINW